MKSIVLYYSQTGNTEIIAKRIAKDFGAELLKIEPDIVYGGFLSSCVRVIGDRMRKDLPTYVTEIPDLTEYDTVFVGFPIWAADVPDFVQAFLKDCDLAGKRVIPFATSRMTGIEGAVDTLTVLCEGASVEHPFFFGVRKRDNYRAWLAEVNAEPEVTMDPEEDSAADEEEAAEAEEQEEAAGAEEKEETVAPEE